MTSVVDTSVKHFHSGMVGAPVLSGLAGSLAALLDACLVVGFDTKTATSLTVSGGVATLSYSGSHSATADSVVFVAGSSITSLNGDQKVTVTAPGVVKFATDAADGTATGTITFKMAPTGMTSPFTGTNLRTYKSSVPASTGMILRLDDTATYQSRVIGYESMSDINNGAGPFPSAVLSATGGYWAKSWAATAAAVPWSIVADGQMFFINIAGNYTSNTSYVGNIVRGFGDMLPRRPGGDPYACVLNCHTDTTAIPAVVTMTSPFSGSNSSGKFYMPREYTGLGGAVMLTCYPYVGTVNTLSGADNRFGSFPGPFGELVLSAKYLASAASGASAFVRAGVPGIYHCSQSGLFDTFKSLDVVQGTGSLFGRKLLVVPVAEAVGAASASQLGTVAFDITGPWR